MTRQAPVVIVNVERWDGEGWFTVTVRAPDAEHVHLVRLPDGGFEAREMRPYTVHHKRGTGLWEDVEQQGTGE